MKGLWQVLSWRISFCHTRNYIPRTVCSCLSLEWTNETAGHLFPVQTRTQLQGEIVVFLTYCFYCTFDWICLAQAQLSQHPVITLFLILVHPLNWCNLLNFVLCLCNDYLMSKDHDKIWMFCFTYMYMYIYTCIYLEPIQIWSWSGYSSFFFRMEGTVYAWVWSMHPPERMIVSSGQRLGLFRWFMYSVLS